MEAQALPGAPGERQGRGPGPAFTGEEEFILPPGTQLEVTDVKAERGGLYTVSLTELDEQTLVS